MNWINLALSLGTLKAKAIGAVVVVLALVALRVWDVQNQRAIGAQKVAAKIEKASNANIKKSEDARSAVDRVPDSGLFDSYRRD